MIKRSECLYKGKIIGIESIYTVVGDKQINIPEKVEALREKGRKGLLVCPCGCGAKLILVAGDKNLRQQHFRIQDGQSWNNCTLKEEGENSINSKIILKCWLDDKMKSEAKTRVSLNEIEETDNKYEISHYIDDKKIGINYVGERANITDDKLNAIQKVFRNDRKIFYIVDISNYVDNGQYPEYMMKIQKRQGYCLFLSIEDRDYYKAQIMCVYYYKNIDGIYCSEIIEKISLNKVDFNTNNDLIIDDRKLNDQLSTKTKEINSKLLEERKKREEAKKLVELQRQRLFEEERKQQEQRRKELANHNKKQEQIKTKKELETKSQEQIDREIQDVIKSWCEQQTINKKHKEETKEKQEYLESKIREDIVKKIDLCIDEPCIDENGEYWYKCKYCGKVDRAKSFSSYGGPKENAKGVCNECSPKIRINTDFEFEGPKSKKNGENDLCPWCGFKLVIRNSRFGQFVGCSNYPNCSYKKNI